MSQPDEKNIGVAAEPESHTRDRKQTYEEGLGDLQVLKVSDTDNVKLDRDGQTVLIPQPSDDPNDPLNWTRPKKHLVLFSIIFASLLTDFSVTYGSPLFIPQAATFGLSVATTSQSVAGCLLLQAVGGVLAVPLIQRFGRLPVLFWSQALCALFLALAAISTSFGAFTTFRTFQGLVNTAPQVLGLSMVHDLFFFHERTSRINVWAFLLIGGPYVGAFASSWLITAVSWQADFGVLAALYVLSSLIVVALGDETLYDRTNPQPRSKGLAARFKLLLGWAGIVEARRSTARPSLWTVAKDILVIAVRPHLLLPTGCYITVFFAWVLAINFTVSSTVAVPPYSFSPQALAAMWVAPFIGALLGQLFGWVFNAFLQRRYIRSHGGKWILEQRLWGNYLPAMLMFTSLVLYGQGLQHNLHWMVLLFAWALLAFSVIATTTATSAYILDCFPQHASLAGCIINFWRTAGGFCAPYFTSVWIATSGAETTFGCMAMLLGVAFLAGVCCTQYFGQRWRQRYPPPRAEN